MSQMIQYCGMDLTKDIDCFLLDLDGTVYFGNRPIEGAIDAVIRMRKSKRVIFLTNNSSATREFYARKLTKMGIPATVEDVYTSANATCDWLIKNRPNAKLYVVASPDVTEEFSRRGLSTDEEADTVVLTFDKTLDYKKLTDACFLISRGAFYIATHPDMTCPVEDGELPDIGSFMRLIEGTTGKLPDLICGKPYSTIAEGVEAMTGIPRTQTAMIGDRLTTDMRFALDNGLKAVLTLSGVTDRKTYEASGLKVDKVIDSLAVWDR